MKKLTVLFGLLSITVSSLIGQSREDLIWKAQKCQQIIDTGSLEEMLNTFPEGEHTDLLKELVKKKIDHKAGSYKILTFSKDSALVLLTARVYIGNSGDETYYSSMYSGVYVFKPVDNKWTITGKLPVDRVNQITNQNIRARIDPEKRTMTVEDRLTLNTRESYGFLMLLNHRAEVKKVQLNKKDVDFVCDGGVLWVNTGKQEKQSVDLFYSIAVDTGIDKNSGFFSDSVGHVRNQFFWHPFFGFSSENDRCSFDAEISIPAAYLVSTSLPQKDAVEGEIRTVSGHSSHPTFGLSVYYDKDWSQHKYKSDNYILDLLWNDSFRPVHGEFFKLFKKDFDVFVRRFGKPLGGYLGVVQDRSSGGNGWKNRANDLIVAAEQGSYMITDTPTPRAILGHEIAHAWTLPAGPCTNFLAEGWASFAEGYLLEAAYGDSSIAKMKAAYKEQYFNNRCDGRISLWEDYGNDGVSYTKGMWLLYMLQDQLGALVFEDGIKRFIHANEPMTIQLFGKKMSEAAGKDIWPLLEPWLKSKQVPHIKAVLQDDDLVVTQEGDVFQFPLLVQFSLKGGGTVEREYYINKAQQSFQLFGAHPSDIDEIKLDPGEKLLIKVLQ